MLRDVTPRIRDFHSRVSFVVSKELHLTFGAHISQAIILRKAKSSPSQPSVVSKKCKTRQMKNNISILLLVFFLGCGQPQKFENSAIGNNASNTDSITSTRDNISLDHTFNLKQALLFPEKVIKLSIGDSLEWGSIQDIKHLPPTLGKLINLKELNFSCLEKLEDLPSEIGNLINLEKLICDNGNGCAMNISIPSTIGLLQSLKELKLYGALDYREIERGNDSTKMKKLPTAFANLKNLEILDLGRNGLPYVPSQIGALKKLKILRLDYNDIHEIPPFISNLTNLQELSVCANEKIRLPKSLEKIQGLKVFMGDDCVKHKDQKELKRRFPNILFSFESEYDQSPECEE